MSETNVTEALETLGKALEQSNTLNAALKEQLSWAAALKTEDIGWAKIFGNIDDDGGPDLDDLKEWSLKLREGLGNVHLGRGLRLRTNNIWAGGIHYSDLPGGTGHKKQTRKWVSSPLNQRNFFGTQARNERESALYTDGMYLVLGDPDPSGYTLEPVALTRIGAFAVNPKREDEIIAYRLDYTDHSVNEPEGRTVREWHYTDLAYTRRGKPGFKLKIEDDETKPDNRVIFDLMVNTHIGWRFGVPDSMAAFAWAKVYRDFIVNGKIMSDAMAQFAYQVSTKSPKESENVGARLSKPAEAGSTLVGANSLVPLTTAGKGYDFDSGRAILSIVAAALEVSVISISSDPGTAGSSYGSASTLDLPTRLAMEARRSLHIDFDKRVLTWMGADPDEVDISFSPLGDSADIYREIQALKLALDSGLYEPEPIENRLSELLDIVGNTVPANFVSINDMNAQTVASQKAQADAEKKAQANAAKKQTAAPGQGKSNGAGDNLDQGNDIRTDNVT